MDEKFEEILENKCLLFRSSEKDSKKLYFDSKGFYLSNEANEQNEQMKDQPHVYLAWSKDETGHFYVGKSFHKGGKWKRQQAYHLGALAQVILGTNNKKDSTHEAWVVHWFQKDTLEKIQEDLYSIMLKEDVYISFVLPYYDIDESESEYAKDIMQHEVKLEEQRLYYYLKSKEYKLLNTNRIYNLLIKI